MLIDLLKARREEMSAAMRDESEKRLDAFYAAMLEANATMDERQARALLPDPDLHSLLRACVADIEAEKVSAYAALARGIANGTVAPQNRRHFILSLSDLSADELDLLRKAFVAHEYEVIPHQGSGKLCEDELLSTGQPGSFQSIHVSNLTARGYVHEGKLSLLGITFTRAIWRPENLTPGSLGYLTWSGHNVVIISYDIGTKESDQVAFAMTEELLRLRSKSFIAAIAQDTVQQAKLQATRGLLLIGDKSDGITAHAGALKNLLAKLPTMGILISPSAVVPDGLRLISVFHYERSSWEDRLSEVCQHLFKGDNK